MQGGVLLDFWEVIKKRRSIRKFDKQKEVSNGQVRKLLEAARLAPSAGNVQSWFFVVVRNPLIKKRLVEATWGQDFITQAPVVIVSCADLERSAQHYSKRGRELYAIQDVTIATQHIWLASVEMGLGACWVGAFDEEEVCRILNLPPNLRPLAILPIGYPAESPKITPRRLIKEISNIDK